MLFNSAFKGLNKSYCYSVCPAADYVLCYKNNTMYIYMRQFIYSIKHEKSVSQVTAAPH